MRTGLRTEIILSISLLLAAALLFAGFLLVKLTERNLLEQQRAHAAGVVRMMAAAEGAGGPHSGVAGLARLQAALGSSPDVLAWRLLDARLQVVASTSYEKTADFAAISPLVLERGELHEDLDYTSWRLFGDAGTENHLDLSTPLWADGAPYALLQVRFSLETLHSRVRGAQELTLVYVIVYGLVLVAFGIYLLNRNVVKPVRLLQQGTTAVAGGSLAPVEVPAGPGEIQALAGSFNRMVSALAASRAETDGHIASLEESNRALAQARDELVRSEKLATVGHLAAGMAHEIGNPLGAVIGYLAILRDDLDGGNRDLVERTLAETGRIDRLVRELLDYAAPAERRVDSFSPVALLRETVEMLRHQGQFDDIEVTDRCSGDGLVSMDRARLMQVWINLLLNARDAMQGAGRIELSDALQGRELSIAIRDGGPGLATDALQRVFEPFYTTKAPGSGYGLGLAVCQRIVVESGGRIEAAAADGQGACFTVTLPLDTRSA